MTPSFCETVYYIHDYVEYKRHAFILLFKVTDKWTLSICDIPFSPGGTSDFKWQGSLYVVMNRNPKNPWTKNLTPKKSHAEFPSLKNFQKTLNDITCLFYLVVLHPQNYAARIHWHYHKSSDCFKIHWHYHKSSDCFKNPKNPYLNQATPKKYLPNFPTQKSPSIRHPCLLKSRVPPGPSHLGTSQYMWKPRDTVV